jgi:hypothetical protein
MLAESCPQELPEEIPLRRRPARSEAERAKKIKTVLKRQASI